MFCLGGPYACQTVDWTASVVKVSSDGVLIGDYIAGTFGSAGKPSKRFYVWHFFLLDAKGRKRLDGLAQTFWRKGENCDGRQGIGLAREVHLEKEEE